MTDFAIDISGIAETQRKLFGFSEKLGKRITLSALRSGANYMKDRIKETAPVKSGLLKRSIAVRNSKLNTIRRNGKVGVFIYVKKGRRARFAKTSVTVGRRGRITTRRVKARKAVGGAFYARWVEDGYTTRSGKKIEGQHFMQKAYRRSRRNARSLIIRNIEVAGERLAGQL